MSPTATPAAVPTEAHGYHRLVRGDTIQPKHVTPDTNKVQIGGETVVPETSQVKPDGYSTVNDLSPQSQTAPVPQPAPRTSRPASRPNTIIGGFDNISQQLSGIETELALLENTVGPVASPTSGVSQPASIVTQSPTNTAPCPAQAKPRKRNPFLPSQQSIDQQASEPAAVPSNPFGTASTSGQTAVPPAIPRKVRKNRTPVVFDDVEYEQHEEGDFVPPDVTTRTDPSVNFSHTDYDQFDEATVRSAQAYAVAPMEDPLMKANTFYPQEPTEGNGTPPVPVKKNSRQHQEKGVYSTPRPSAEPAKVKTDSDEDEFGYTKHVKSGKSCSWRRACIPECADCDTHTSFLCI